MERRGREWGVEPISAQSQIASYISYNIKSRPASAHRLRDEALGPALKKLWEKNY